MSKWKTIPKSDSYYLMESQLDKFMELNGADFNKLNREMPDDGSGVLFSLHKNEMQKTDEEFSKEYDDSCLWVKRFYEAHELEEENIYLMLEY